jgi:hypothetical protein
MEFDDVAAKALGVEGSQDRRVLVGLPREIEHLGAAPVLAEGRERGRLTRGAVAGERALQRPIAGIEIDVHVGRRLVCRVGPRRARLSSHGRLLASAES